ncbi:Secreted frizzled-related protein 2 [Echinococcus granulosus]|uniref:Secreted frizzled protein n=1 Tax=Echinococcus granulosus TaxID=6210 RepID=A0A068WE98_ECHGR|nr:Secreted frizzled-related protein 2 [Echinococcus granulosus]CDS15976.1 secreted frizzled protein [Echinococcus granulosus]
MLPIVILFAISAAQANTVGRWDWYRGGGAKNKTAVTSSPFGGTSLSRLTTADVDMISNEPPQSPYFSDWNRLVSGYGSQRCYKIPRGMKLCHKIGYDFMVLPNSLEHETLDEAITQSEVWLTLVNLGCHDELKRFLCSLYAPVCINGYHEKLIQPCRELCESVRAACLPTMTTFGLGWPDIVKCSKFPQAPQELCIPLNKHKNKTIILNPETRCSGCIDRPTYESAIGSFCTADVVIRAKVLDLVPTLPSSGHNTTHRIRTTGRVGAFKLPKTLNSVVNLDFEMECDCPIIRAALTRQKGPGRWLMMGKLNDDRRTVTVQHISQPSRQNAGIKRAIRDIRRRPDSLCKVDLMHPNPVAHSRAISSLSSPSSMQSLRPQSRQSRRYRPHLSPEERRRRQLRRRRNHPRGSSPEAQQRAANVTPSRKPPQLQQQPINDIPILTPTPRPFSHHFHRRQLQQKRMGYLPQTQ